MWCDVYNSSQFSVLWLSFPHCRCSCMLGHCEYSSEFVCPACLSTVLPWSHPSSLCECLYVSVSFSWVLACVACPISLVRHSHKSKFVPLQSHGISKGRKEIVHVNVTGTKSPSHTRFSCEECKFQCMLYESHECYSNWNRHIYGITSTSWEIKQAFCNTSCKVS